MEAVTPAIKPLVTGPIVTEKGLFQYIVYVYFLTLMKNYIYIIFNIIVVFFLTGS